MNFLEYYRRLRLLREAIRQTDPDLLVDPIENVEMFIDGNIYVDGGGFKWRAVIGPEVATVAGVDVIGHKFERKFILEDLYKNREESE